MSLASPDFSDETKQTADEYGAKTMKRRYRESYEDDLLRDGQRLRVPMFAMDSAQRSATAHFPRVHDGTGDSDLAMHRPGFRVTDTPPPDELQRAREAYEHRLTTSWRRDAGKEGAVPDAPKASGNDAMPADDIETAYRLYGEEISHAWKKTR
jgi:hypothetical protein